MLKCTLTIPNVFVFALLSSVPVSTNLLTTSDEREIWTCTQFTYGSEPNLDVYAV